jgi:uncharacterized membrane protein
MLNFSNLFIYMYFLNHKTHIWDYFLLDLHVYHWYFLISGGFLWYVLCKIATSGKVTTTTQKDTFKNSMGYNKKACTSI